MISVRKYKGRQRQLIRATIKLMNELTTDATKHPLQPLCNSTVLTSYVAPLLAAMVVDLAATTVR